MVRSRRPASSSAATCSSTSRISTKPSASPPAFHWRARARSKSGPCGKARRVDGGFHGSEERGAKAMIKGLRGATIWSEDLNNLLPFYRDVLGLKVGLQIEGFVVLGDL